MEFEVPISGFRVSFLLLFWVWDLGFGVWDFEFRGFTSRSSARSSAGAALPMDLISGFRVPGFEVRDHGSRFNVFRNLT